MELKRDLRPNSPSFLVSFKDREPYENFYEVTTFCIQCTSISILMNLTFFLNPCIFLLKLWGEPSTKFYGVFDHFSLTDEVEKFCNIKLYLRVNDGPCMCKF